MEAIYFDGTTARMSAAKPMPAEMRDEANAARQHMLEALSMYSDELMELMLAEEEVPLELIHSIVKAGRAEPGSDARVHGHGLQEQGRAAAAGRRRALFAFAAGAARSRPRAYANPDEKFPLEPDPSKPFVGMAFKIVEDPFGQLTFMRIYQGRSTRAKCTSTSAPARSSASAAS